MLPVENHNSLVTGSLADPVTGLHVEIPDCNGKHVLKVTHLEDRVKIELAPSPIFSDSLPVLAFKL
jgi:hypothetical protein